MLGETATRTPTDEDTQVGFYGHITNQTKDPAEQPADDRERRQTGREQSPNRKHDHGQRKNKKRSSDNRE